MTQPVQVTNGPLTGASPGDLVRQREALACASLAAARLGLFRGVVEDEVGRAFLQLLDLLIALTSGSGVATEGGETSRGEGSNDGRALPLPLGEGWGEGRALAAAYGRVFAVLAAAAEDGVASREVVGDTWQNHLLDRLLLNENPFTRQAERAPLAALGPSLVAAAREELRALQQLFVLDACTIRDLVARALSAPRLVGAAATADGWVAWERLHSAGGNAASPQAGPEATLVGPALQDSGIPDSRAGSSAATAVKRRLAAAPDWGAELEALAAHYRSAGIGIFARYRAFRWVRSDGQAGEWSSFGVLAVGTAAPASALKRALPTGAAVRSARFSALAGAVSAVHGGLEPVATPDPVRLDELVGYDAERAPLVRNTEHLLRGLPANNVLLYGDRGSGKSSTVKALLNAYAARGLRLVEVPKHLLGDFPHIAALLRGRPERFVLFVDDLSFDEHETEYRDLKAILEGSLEAKPENVVLYATSNRRHLVKERFADRADPGSDEVHARDTVEEKLSLADRFGITIIFSAPDQERYLAIVQALAARRGVEVPPAELRHLALQWAARHNGRSGRAARQFVDWLAAERSEG